MLKYSLIEIENCPVYPPQINRSTEKAEKLVKVIFKVYCRGALGYKIKKSRK